MAEKLEDLNLPTNTVQKIIKDSIPENVLIGKDARAALSKAASVFVLYVTSQATKEAQKNNRKMLLGQDIIAALEELEFEEFIEPLQTMFKEFKESAKQKKSSKLKKDESEVIDVDEGVGVDEDEENAE